MDIVVTIPKSEYDNDDLETKDMEEKDYVQFWTMNKVPKKLELDDRIYFVKNGYVESSMRVFDIMLYATKKCETTGRVWSGKCQLFMDDLRKENGLQVKGFQGFRYRWW